MKRCSKCGAENADESVFCAGCGASLDQYSQQQAAPSPSPFDAPAYTAPAVPVEKNTATLWLILNICLTVLCGCNILGIIGLIFAAIGMGSYNKGDYEDMRKKTKISKILFIVGIIVGVIFWIVAFAVGLLGTLLPFLNTTGY